jgi:hypothetical protein
MRQHRGKIAPLSADSRDEEWQIRCDLTKLRHRRCRGRSRYKADSSRAGLRPRRCESSDAKIERLFWC